MRVVIYVRYSSDHQSEASLEDQLRLGKERVTREKWTLVQVYRDAAMSAASTLRPGYQALLEGVRCADFDLILVEALDRLSRDQEDIAALYKRCSFAGVRIVTLAEGDITELHIGLKGTMNALFLKDLADKTRRGLRGRVEAGASGGGLTYGYDVVPSLEQRGDRRINEPEAGIVRWIYQAYADGLSPKRMAHALNAQGIPAPRGGKWSASTINGNRARGTGIINNELYAGRQLWNRLHYSKDPDSGKRRSRLNDPSAVVVTAVSALRIIEHDLWEAVRTRQAELSPQKEVGGRPTPYWSQQRPRYLFSGLMRCGMCGGGFSKISAAHFGCSTARNKGRTACDNLLTLRRDRLESTVLEGLRGRLMDPDLFKAFAAEFTLEWNRLQSEANGELEARKTELARVKGQLERLVDALVQWTPVVAIRDRMQTLERRRVTLEAELATAVAPAPRLHPNLAVVYREKVATLIEAPDATENANLCNLVRSLVEEIRLVPEDGCLRIELRGELAAILSLAGAANGKRPGGEAEALAVQVKMVAGTGFEPVTFRL